MKMKGLSEAHLKGDLAVSKEAVRKGSPGLASTPSVLPRLSVRLRLLVNHQGIMSVMPLHQFRVARDCRDDTA
jgi:hypothetical protein